MFDLAIYVSCLFRFFCVLKIGGGLRPCIGYRGLNKITATVFTKLDLRNAYHLFCMRRGDEWKLPLAHLVGTNGYKVMPFGWPNYPTVFQGLVNDVLREMINHCVFVYLDYILICS